MEKRGEKATKQEEVEGGEGQKAELASPPTFSLSRRSFWENSCLFYQGCDRNVNTAAL